MTQKPVYLCYAPADNDFAQRLRQHLEANKFPVTDLPRAAADPPDTLPPEGSRQIGEAQCVVVVVTNALYTHRLCVLELLHAIKKKQRLIPVVWQHTSPTDIRANPPANWTTFEADFQTIKTAVDCLDWIIFTQPELGAADPFDLHASILEKTISTHEPFIFSAFMSYNRLNGDLVRAVKSQLKQMLYNLWFDADNIPKARPWLDEIKAGIDRSNNCLLFVSSSWLGSDNCDAEWVYAQERCKRMIPIFFAELDVDNEGKPIADTPLREPNLDSILKVYRARKASGSWEQLGKMSDADVRAFFEERLDRLRAADPVYVPAKYLDTGGKLDPAFFNDPAFHEIRNRLNANSEYLTEHTKLLLRAVDHQQGNGRLLNAREWWAESRWLSRSLDESPPPSPLHWRYVQQSLRWLLARSAALGFLVAVIFAGFTTLSASEAQARAALAEQEVEAQRALNAEINNRLQTQAQSAQQRAIALNGQPRRPALAHNQNALWVSLGDQVQQIALDGRLLGEAVPAGPDAGTPVVDGDLVWVVGVDRLTRIDATGVQPPKAQTIGVNLSQPMIIGDWVWVHSGLSNTLTRIRRAGGEPGGQVALSPDEQVVIAGGGYLWSWDDNRLRRVRAPGEQQIFDGFGDIHSAAFAEERLWLAAGGQLYRVNPADGAAEAVTAVASSLEAPLVAGGAAWAIARAANLVYGFDAQTLAVRYQIEVNAPHRLFYTEGRLWVFTSADVVYVYDTESGQPIAELPLPGSNRVDALVNDGENVWIAPADQGTVWVARQSDGVIYREFQPCDGRVLPPVYDGAAMWFACPDNARLVSMPASMYFFGERTIQPDTGDHRPVARGQRLWMTQEATGRVLVYDMLTGQGAVAADFGSALLPLIDDGTDYLWTAVAATGEIVRFSPETFTFTAAQPAYMQRRSLGHAVYALHLVDTVVWALHNDTSTDDAPNYSLVNRDSLEVVTQNRLALVPMGLTAANGYAWMPVSTLLEGKLYRIDAATGLNPLLLEIEDTDFGAWPGVLADDSLWFSVVVAPTDELIPQLTGMILPGHQLDTSPFSVRQLDPETAAWGQRWPLPGPTSGALWDGEYLWYTLLTAPSVPVVGEQESGIGKFALRLSDGAITPETPGGWSFCEYVDPADGQRRFGTTGNLYRFGDLLFSGCLDHARDVAVFRRQPSPDLLTVHRNVGLFPWEPASDGNVIWMTFRDSDNAAVFDLVTGDLLRVVGLRRAPTPPLIAGDSVWIYHSGDDVLQRLALRP